MSLASPCGNGKRQKRYRRGSVRQMYRLLKLKGKSRTYGLMREGESFTLLLCQLSQSKTAQKWCNFFDFRAGIISSIRDKAREEYLALANCVNQKPPNSSRHEAAPACARRNLRVGLFISAQHNETQNEKLRYNESMRKSNHSLSLMRGNIEQ